MGFNLAFKGLVSYSACDIKHIRYIIKPFITIICLFLMGMNPSKQMSTYSGTVQMVNSQENVQLLYHIYHVINSVQML
jgi:hypothetical protein